MPDSTPSDAKVVRVGHFGTQGSYSECAARSLLAPLVRADAFCAVGHKSFEELFKAVSAGTIDLGIVSVETSMGGSIHTSFDLLLQFNTVHILGEIDFRVEHCLMALPGVKREDITKVISHESVIRDCDDYLKEWGVQSESRADSATAAQELVQKQLRNTAAVGSELCAQMNGLEILDRSLQGVDAGENFTRSLLIGGQAYKANYPGTAFKTSIVFKLPYAQDSLFKSLSVFSMRDINLTKMESRPVPAKYLEKFSREAELSPPGKGAPEKPQEKQKYEYLLYIDALEQQSSTRMQKALKHLREITPFARVLGSYPCDGADHEELCKAAMVAASAQGAAVPKPVTTQLKIAILGFGNFGQFLAKEFVKRHLVYGCSMRSYAKEAAELGATWVDWADMADLLLVHSVDVILIATSITSFQSVVDKLPREAMEKTKPLIADVLSVKVHPKNVLLKDLPDGCDVVCTHPMFGPESGKHGWYGLAFVFEVVRARNWERARRFVGVFEEARCRMVCMSCEEHDQFAAATQFLTHFTGRSLAHTGCTPTSIDLKGYESLCKVVDVTCKDSFDLFYGLFKYNDASTDTINKLKRAFSEIEERLKVRRNMSSSNLPVLDEGGSAGSLASGLAEDGVSAIEARVRQLRRAGKRVVSLSGATPNYAPPEEVVRAVADAAAATAEPGSDLELRRQLAVKLSGSYDESHVCICSCRNQALLVGLMSFLQENDQVLVPTPSMGGYADVVQLCGAVPVPIPAAADGGLWDPKVLQAQIEEMADRCKAIVLCNPCNPTGAVPTMALFESLAEVLRRPKLAHILVLVDKSFQVVPQVFFASIEGMQARTIVVGSQPQTMPLQGISIGYVAASPQFAEAAAKLRDCVGGGPSPLALAVANAAVKVPEDWAKSLGQELARKRDFAVRKLQEAKCGNPVAPPLRCEGFFLLADLSACLGRRSLDDFCKELLESHGVAVLSGRAFDAPDSVRINLACPMEDLEFAMANVTTCLAAFCSGDHGGYPAPK